MAEKEKKRMGPPYKEIDKEEFEKLMALHPTIDEVEFFFDCDEDTITDWCRRTYGLTYSGAFKKYSGQGKLSLRRKQYMKAVHEGNVPLLIWLGKQYLGQVDSNNFNVKSEFDAKRLVIKLDKE